MNAKHKEWYNKMSGFYDSEKMRKVQKDADEEELLKEKLRRKQFEWPEDHPEERMGYGEW
jgi:hypothetical protein